MRVLVALVCCAKMAERIQVLFGGDLLGPKKHASDEGTYGRHLANTIEPSMLGEWWQCWLYHSFTTITIATFSHFVFVFGSVQWIKLVIRQLFSAR